MEIISIIFGSAVFMWVVAFVCAILCIRCLVHGFMGGTSTLLRILCALLFGCLTYYCYRHAMLAHGPNVIDNFVYDTWIELKQFFHFIKAKFL